MQDYKKSIQKSYKDVEDIERQRKTIHSATEDIKRIMGNFSKEVDDFLKEK